MLKLINKKATEGVSLIEVMVVVVFLAILILLASSNFLKNILRGNDARKKADLNKIKIYIEEYEKDHNCYPTAESMSLCGSSTTIAIHPYLFNVPCDPLTKEPYAYEPDPDNTSCPSWFRLYTKLQNESDPKIINFIGPGDAYNYYVSSENAPRPTPCSSSPYYGCFSGVCRQVCSNECIGRQFSNSVCNYSCGNPSSECVP